MESRGDRRSFFRQLLRESLSAVNEFRGSTDERDAWSEPPPESHDPDPAPHIAAPASRMATPDDLPELAKEAGLEGRTEDLVRLARPSLRATSRNNGRDERSLTRFGGAPDLPQGFAWPTHHGKLLSFVAQIDLADWHGPLRPPSFPERGLLTFFTEPGPSVSVDDVGCQVVYFDQAPIEHGGPPPEAEIFTEYAVDLSYELTIPDAWSFPAEPLELSEQEVAQWDEVRALLAELQGLARDELTSERLVVHRLLGYPESLGGDMELDVELGRWDEVAAKYSETMVGGDLLERARRWQLLFQVSDDGAFRVSQHPRFGRLYFWIASTDLDAFRFDDVRAVVR